MIGARQRKRFDSSDRENDLDIESDDAEPGERRIPVRMKLEQLPCERRHEENQLHYKWKLPQTREKKMMANLTSKNV